MGSQKKGPSVHVVPTQTPSGTKLTIKEAGNERPLIRPTTQERAIERGRPIARENQSELVIHRRNGQIRDSDSQGHDPNPPKDRR
jgi:hypothetical protein